MNLALADGDESFVGERSVGQSTRMNFDDKQGTLPCSIVNQAFDNTGEPRVRSADKDTRPSILFSHSPGMAGLSVQALPAIMDSSTTPVNSRSRSRAVPGTRWTRCSLIIAVPDGRESARPASRLRVVPRACFSASCIIPTLFPPRADATASSFRLLSLPLHIALPKFRLDPTHLSLINRRRLIIPLPITRRSRCAFGVARNLWHAHLGRRGDMSFGMDLEHRRDKRDNNMTSSMPRDWLASARFMASPDRNLQLGDARGWFDNLARQ